MVTANGTVRQVPCPARVAEMLRDLHAAHQRTERDLQVAFCLFARAQGLPDSVTFHGVSADAVLIGGLPPEAAEAAEATDGG